MVSITQTWVTLVSLSYDVYVAIFMSPIWRQGEYSKHKQTHKSTNWWPNFAFQPEFCPAKLGSRNATLQQIKIKIPINSIFFQKFEVKH